MIDSAVLVAAPVETGRMPDDQQELTKTHCADCPHRRNLLANGRCKPGDTLNPLIVDPDREVRLRIAERIGPADGLSMLSDSDWRVRLRLAERLPLNAIEPLTRDEDAGVRAVAVARAEVDLSDPGEEE